MIPEHTDRAARIKQSRVKMMRLKAKIEEGDCRIEDERSRMQGGSKEKEKEREKSSKGFPKVGIKI